MNIIPDEYLNKLPDFHRDSLDRNLCVCNEVAKRNVIAAIIEGADTVAKIREKTYASDGNGCCKNQLQRFIDYLEGD